MEPLKNKLTMDTGRRISPAVQRVFPDFNVRRFQRELSDALELKARMLLIAVCLVISNVDGILLEFAGLSER